MYNIIKKIYPPETVVNTNADLINTNINNNDNYTIPFFSNPNYLARINMHKKNTSEIHDVSKCEFYKKRTCGLFKELYKNKDVPDSIKNAHTAFNKLVISYFETMDTSDIIQRIHSNASAECVGVTPSYNADLSDNDIDISNNISNNINNNIDIDTALFNVSKPSLLDSYVKTIKHKNTLAKPMFIPSKINIDIRADEFKTKGIKSVKF